MKGLLTLVAAATLYGSALGVLREYNTQLSRLEYLTMPAPVTTQAMAAGYENIVADTLYVHFIYYFGKHLRSKQASFNLAPMANLIVDLDPQFEGAYNMGALALGDNGQVDAAEALWNKAVAAIPDRWDIPYQAGISLFLFGDTPAQYLRAAELFRKAAKLPGAPSQAHFMEARMYDVSGRNEMAAALWLRIYRDGATREEREVAKRTLEKMGHRLPTR